MKIKKWIGSSLRQRGIALVLVVGALALMVVLLLAMFSVTQTEFSSTRGHVAAQSAKQYSDVATAIVQAQIQNGQNTKKTASDRTIHATQPGAVQVYNKSGFLAGYRLYSSSKMAETTAGDKGEEAFVTNSTVPSDWDSEKNKARYVDLNEPVVRAPLAGTVPAVHFPIIDPRAAFNDPATHVEGFDYTEKNLAGETIGGVKAPDNSATTFDPAAASLLRLPMPVEWMYILQDGTFGTLDADNKFVTATPGVEPTISNPIVSRIAFWTDDESCKVNINTAAEPTFMNSPYYFHDRDRKWAHFPPAAGEYQRYPGHPATVALSSVLLPNLRLDSVNPDTGLSVYDVRDLKEQIYDFAPKIVRGGSKSGTVPFIADDLDGTRPEDPATPAKGSSETPSKAIDISVSKRERLYATVDEMLFKDGNDLASPRGASRYPSSGSSPDTLPNGRVLFDHGALERSRFFLTANSRAPEFTIHGLPRICIWPVADETQALNKPAPDKLRTELDKIIALCATNRRATSETSTSVKNSYFFRRSLAHHPTHDVTGAASGQSASPGLARNSLLLEYITKQLTKLNYPQSGSTTGASASFQEKYGTDNVNQLAIQIFDYIRCTNLFDGILAEFKAGDANKTIYEQRDAIAAECKTFTNQRSSSGSPYPGHGQVTPARWNKDGKDYRGFGRMFTLSEIGFRVICTADGKNDEYAIKFGDKEVLSGGGTAIRVDPSVSVGQGQIKASTNSKFYGRTWTLDRRGPSRWYSNFPPLSVGVGGVPTQAEMFYGTDVTKTREPDNYHPANHPGYNPANWNLSLAENTPLQENEKRIQAILLLEAFCPSVGFTSIYPEYTIVLDKNYMRGIQIMGSANGAETPVKLFDTDQEYYIRSDQNVYGSNPVGGFVNPSQFFAFGDGRFTRAILNSPGVAYESANGEKFGPGNPILREDDGYAANPLKRFQFTSDFITVDRNKEYVEFIFPKEDFVITIYDTNDPSLLNSEHLVQTIKINMNDGSTKMAMPYLVGSNESIDKGGRNSGWNFQEWVDDPPKYPPNDPEHPGYTPYHYVASMQPPRFWCFNYDGVVGRKKGVVNDQYKEGDTEPFWSTEPSFAYSSAPGEASSLKGRLCNTYQAVNLTDPGLYPGHDDETSQSVNADTVSDVVRTVVPKVGDYRIVAARNEVPNTMWTKHPYWSDLNIIGRTENKSGQTWTGKLDNPESVSDLPDQSYFDTELSPLKDANRLPDLPPDSKWVLASRSFGDFDVAVSNGREGPYINKPDEGTFHAANREVQNEEGVPSTVKFYRGANFYSSTTSTSDSTDDTGKTASGNHMTPNRMISSPVLFGSLPTGVWPGGAAADTASALNQGGLTSSYADSNPWQTLLFRPYVPSSTDGATTHPGSLNPRDHYLLDLFFMPVVEPYAISEPLSEAGKINLNYQILPFTNIRRATALHALLKGEFMTAIPNKDAVNAKKMTNYSFKGTDERWDAFWNDVADRTDPFDGGKKYWHRPIDVVETLRQFEDKFSFSFKDNATKKENGLFRSASQICEVHLVPDVSGGVGEGEGSETSTGMKNMTATTRARNMEKFWQAHSPTGDNIRERPYSNIYSRVTTRSNTFRIHVRAQVIKKSRSTDPATFDPDKDAVLSEYRGSTVLERYIDPTDTENPLPDYASAADPFAEEPLDAFYKFHVLETKRFNP